MASKTNRTGFMDLPLELRQQIYSYILPENRQLFFSGKREEKITLAISTMSPDNGKAAYVTYRECSVHITIQPERATDFLDGIELHRFKRIIVLIDNYASWRMMHRGDLTGISTFVKLLRTGRPERLPHIVIFFLEGEYG